MPKNITKLPPLEQIAGEIPKAAVVIGIEGEEDLALAASFKRLSSKVFSFTGFAAIPPKAVRVIGELDYNLGTGWIETKE